MAVPMKGSSQNRTDLSGSPWNDNLHIAPPCSLDESAPEFRRRRKTLLETAEHAIPISGDDVVRAVQYRAWQDARNHRRLPRPPKLARDEERCVAPGEDPAVTGPVVCQNVKGCQFGGVAGETLNHRSASCALERSECEYAAAVVSEEELKQAAAQPTNSVVEHEVSALATRCRLRR
jgi:hypothetical protein